MQVTVWLSKPAALLSRVGAHRLQEFGFPPCFFFLSILSSLPQGYACVLWRLLKSEPPSVSPGLPSLCLPHPEQILTATRRGSAS